MQKCTKFLTWKLTYSVLNKSLKVSRIFNMEIDLFGIKAEKMVEEVKPKKKTTRTPRKKEPTTRDLKWEVTKAKDRLKELEEQDESKFSDFELSIKGKKVNMPLVKNHIIYYQKQVDELRKPFLPLLNKWKDFIVNYCLNNKQEIDVIWFNESCPYDVDISVRLKGHRCWNSCVSFRFQDGKLKAFDSHFGGGTTSLWFSEVDYLNNPKVEEDKVKEILLRVFNKECSNSSWEDDDEEVDSHREIKLDDFGFIDD